MAEYSWTIRFGKIRIGWMKHKFWEQFYEHCYRGYVRVGHLDLYNEQKFDGRVLL